MGGKCAGGIRVRRRGLEAIGVRGANRKVCVYVSIGVCACVCVCACAYSPLPPRPVLFETPIINMEL